MSVIHNCGKIPTGWQVWVLNGVAYLEQVLEIHGTRTITRSYQIIYCPHCGEKVGK